VVQTCDNPMEIGSDYMEDSFERATSPSQRPLPTQHTPDTRENILTLRGIRTCDPINLAHGHWHRPVI